MQSTYPQQASAPFGGTITGLGSLLVAAVLLIGVIATFVVAAPRAETAPTFGDVSAPALVEHRAGERVTDSRQRAIAAESERLTKLAEYLAAKGSRAEDPRPAGIGHR